MPVNTAYSDIDFTENHHELLSLNHVKMVSRMAAGIIAKLE